MPYAIVEWSDELSSNRYLYNLNFNLVELYVPEDVKRLQATHTLELAKVTDDFIVFKRKRKVFGKTLDVELGDESSGRLRSVFLSDGRLFVNPMIHHRRNYICDLEKELLKKGVAENEFNALDIETCSS